MTSTSLRNMIVEMTPEAVAARMRVAPAVVVGWTKHGVPEDMTVDVERTLTYLMKEELLSHQATMLANSKKQMILLCTVLEEMLVRNL